METSASYEAWSAPSSYPAIEPMSEIWVHAATSIARLYRNGRTKVAASVHCRPPQPSECAFSKPVHSLRGDWFAKFAN